MLVALDHAGHAMRRATRMRMCRSIRTQGSGRCAWKLAARRVDRACRELAPRRFERRRLEILWRLPSEAPSEEGRCPSGPTDRGGRPSIAFVYRVHSRVQYLLRGGMLCAGDRDHANATSRNARLRALPTGCRRGGFLTRTDRLLQLR